MLRHLYGDVYYWTEHHGKPETTYDWNSCAIRIDWANVLALVDPLPLTDAEIGQIEEIGTPTHILLTCNWHLRGDFPTTMELQNLSQRTRVIRSGNDDRRYF